MAPCVKQTFLAITPDQFNCLIARATANGLPINGNSGQASANGFTLSWTYNPAAQMLDIQCLSSPPLVPCAMINLKIKGLIAECAV